MIYDPMYTRCMRGHAFLAACELGQTSVIVEPRIRLGADSSADTRRQWMSKWKH